MTRHNPTRRDLLKLGGAALAASAMPVASYAAAASDEPRKVLFFTKSAGFEHSVIQRQNDQLGHAERVLIEIGKEHGLEVTATKDGRIFDGDLDQFDVFCFYTTGDLTKVGRDKAPAMSPAGKKALLDAIASGKGFVGSHCAADTFHTPGNPRQNQDRKDPYIEMIGGEFISHGRQQLARMTVVNHEFPGMAAAGDGFDLHEEWYSLKNFAPDLHVLLVNETEGMDGKDYQRRAFPATWARRHGEGRVFYTSMGHREDVWVHPIFQSILIGGIHWAVGVEQADVPANIAKVTPDANMMPPA